MFILMANPAPLFNRRHFKGEQGQVADMGVPMASAVALMPKAATR